MEIGLKAAPMDGVTVNAAVKPLAEHHMPATGTHEQATVDLESIVTATEKQISPTPPVSPTKTVSAGQSEESAIEITTEKAPDSVPTTHQPPVAPQEHHAKNGTQVQGPAHGAHVTDGQSKETQARMPFDRSPLQISVDQLQTTGLKEPDPKPSLDTPVLSPFKNDKQDSVATETITSKAPTPTVTVEEIVLPATQLKRLLEDTKDLIVCPGVYDGFSARIALSIGFHALYMTGAGTTASRLGQPDLGIAQLSDMRAQADMIANLDPYGTPVIADMDTGYGGPNTIALAVQQYVRANVAGFHIEDQVLTKRCGHLSGKKVVSAPVYFSRLRAAKAAKDRARSDIVLIARTDANQQLGYDECIARLRVARDIGADVGLLEGFKSKEQAAQAVWDLAPWPLLLNIVENGHSPLITVEEAREMGFRIMIFSFAGLAPAFGAIKGAYERLKYEGVTGVQGSGVSPRSIFEVCGLGDCMRIDEEAGGEDFKGGV